MSLHCSVGNNGAMLLRKGVKICSPGPRPVASLGLPGHSRVGGNPFGLSKSTWIPAYAGMTAWMETTLPARHDRQNLATIHHRIARIAPPLTHHELLKYNP